MTVKTRRGRYYTCVRKEAGPQLMKILDAIECKNPSKLLFSLRDYIFPRPKNHLATDFSGGMIYLL
ncbi:unnamed protein product [Acanthoscelides obtectus]|uniref:Uncharacterized protein n=1 Tax=Acanthoscelides obtectus TaxID=200917 RepID=A0A9P0JL10_ACAOB|nr:unnamed protein product [Acanthoscelides obtectus]CAK1628865.1 hypothetical protein AOBTE_LOCUS5439 [Acanthoscelides obtectus]